MSSVYDGMAKDQLLEPMKCKHCGHEPLVARFIGGKWWVMCEGPSCKPGTGVGRPLSDGKGSVSEAWENFKAQQVQA